MAIWSVRAVEWDSSSGGITLVWWQAGLVGGESDNEHVTVTGTTTYVPDPESPSFVPLEDVDEQLTLSWVWEREDRAAVEASLLAELTRRLAPGAGLPWAAGVGAA